MFQRVALYLQDAHDLRDGLDYVRYAEEKGFEAVWQAESRLVRDAIVPMAAYAAVTKRIKVGSGVINNWTRNIGLLAATYLTLDDLAPGRIICGIGAWWDPLARNVGIDRRKPLTAMKETVLVMKRLLNMERVTFHGEFINVESKAVKSNDESGFGTILSRQLIEIMGGDFIAESPSGISGEKGTRIRFTIQVYSNERIVKNISPERIRSIQDIKTLVITGQQNRDEDILASLHKIGLSISVTSFQKSTVGQLKSNLNQKADRYNLIIITDDAEFNGFDAARTIWENNLSGQVVLFMISSNDLKGNYMKCITMGIDQYLVKPFDSTELMDAIRNSFPYIETGASIVDISKAKNDLRILVVEDNKMNQKVIVTMLKSLGYSCDVTDDGYDGYLQAKKQKYDIIFMDLIMPEMNGFDSARKILAIDKEVLIVAFTADNMPDARRKAELSGIKEFIAKPVRVDELKKLFAKHFKKNGGKTYPSHDISVTAKD